jgi:hypothetical protein
VVERIEQLPSVWPGGPADLRVRRVAPRQLPAELAEEPLSRHTHVGAQLIDFRIVT